MKRIFKADESLENRLHAVVEYLEQLQLHRDSRRGPEGKPGRDGADSIVPGPVGPAPDLKEVIAEAVKVAKAEVRADLERDFGWYLNADVLTEFVKHILVVVGAIDESGKAILIPGKDGRDGIDGKSGRDGVGRDGVDGAPGRDGRDGVDGKSPKIKLGVVTDGETASASLTESADGFILNLTLPRGEKGQDGVSNVAGARGEQGEIGPRGIPGVGITKAEVVEIIQRAIRT